MNFIQRPFVLFLLMLSLLSCDDDDGTISVAPLIEHRAIYINDFQVAGILGDVIKEDSLLNWCDINDFTGIYLYNIGSILTTTPAKNQLNSFVEKAYTWSPKLNVTFVSAGHGTSFDNIIDYHQNFSQIPTGIVSEIEFWNGSGSFTDDYIPWMARMNHLKSAIPIGATSPLNPNLVRRFYIGKIKDAEGLVDSLTVAKQLIQNHDEIFLTNYHSNAFNLSASESTHSIKNKLRLLGQAGLELNKVANIVILFNVRQDSPAANIWSYFSTTGGNNEFEIAYSNFFNEYDDATDIANKDFLKLKGFGIYRYSDARLARP